MVAFGVDLFHKFLGQFIPVTSEPVATLPGAWNRLIGLVVKASALGAEDPGFEFRLRQDFFSVESYQ